MSFFFFRAKLIWRYSYFEQINFSAYTIALVICKKSMLAFYKIFLNKSSKSRCENRIHFQKGLVMPKGCEFFKFLNLFFLQLKEKKICKKYSNTIQRMLIHICAALTFLGMSSIQSTVQAYRYIPETISSHSDLALNYSGNLPLIFSVKRPDVDHSRHIILAHAIVVRTSPSQDGEGQADIGKVDVWYDAGIRDSLAALAVVSESGERVDKKDAAIDSADPAHVSVSVATLAPGKYTVRYRALSADGHMVSGAWEFQVK